MNIAGPLERDAVAVAGPDAASYLQGQLSQDVGDLAPGAAVWSLLLEPSGKVCAWLRVARTGAESFVLDVDAGAGTAVVERLRRFLLRTRCTVDPVPGPTVAVRGPAGPPPGVPDERRLPVVWPGVGGFDLRGGAAADVEGATVVDAAELEVLRIECGVPRTGAELTDRTIPAEAGQWLIDASVSFTKGCYTGQELVARVDSRGGNVPRRLRVVVVGAGTAPPVGAVLRPAGEPGGRDLGTITSVAWSARRGATVALAFVARSVEPPAPVEVAWDGGRADGVVHAAPLPA